jgi:hypothetical protein
MAIQAPARRRRSKLTDEELAAHKAEVEARRAAIQLAADAINDEAPDFKAFLARWGNRYAENNLRRLWVQCPRATCLHMLPTWRGMGRKVRAGQKAIWLQIPRTSTDPDKVTPENPTGEVFHGAAWTALFDFSQTDGVGDFTDPVPRDAAPGLADEVKRLRTAALAEHPDVAAPNTGPDDEAFQAACEKFATAWKRYEDARDRLKGGKK